MELIVKLASVSLMKMKHRKRVLNRMEDEQERMRGKSRRKAFWGLQIKYTLTPICLLYGIVFAILLGMFLYVGYAERHNVEKNCKVIEATDTGCIILIPTDN